MPAPTIISPAFERHYSPAEVAAMWSMHVDTVRKIFNNEPGVINISLLPKAKHKTIRIPQVVLDRVHRRRTQV